MSEPGGAPVEQWLAVQVLNETLSEEQADAVWAELRCKAVPPNPSDVVAHIREAINRSSSKSVEKEG